VISVASVLRLRCAAMRRLRRAVGVAVIGWIALVVAGREHALQAIGVEIACVHPGTVNPVHPTGDDHAALASEPDVPHAPHEAHVAAPLSDVDVAEAPDADESDDCPVGCSGCACGAAPFAVPTVMAMAARSWSDALFVPRPGSLAPRRTPTELERPPRRRA
jgi:hypothetical protein